MRLEIEQVSKNTVAVTAEELASNAGAVLFGDFIVAVDATMRPDTSRMFRGMLEEEFARPVKYLGVTHYHGDHVFGLKPFKDATIFASAPLAENLRQRMRTDWTPEALSAWRKEDPARNWVDDAELFVPPLLFHGGIEIADGDLTIEFHHAGGHTSCSAYAYCPQDKVLLAGDLVFAGRVPFAGDITCDPEQWIAVLTSWLDLEIGKIIPGHGPVTDRGEIERHLEFFRLLKDAAIDAARTGKSHRDIAFPRTYAVGEKDQRLMEMTQRRWYEYYGQRCR